MTKHTQTPRVAFILTSNAKAGDVQSGYWFEELAAPYYVFLSAGWDITIASIKGGAAPRDPMSENADWMTDATRRFAADTEAEGKVSRTVAVSDLKPDEFSAVFLVGGIATMWDFPGNPHLAALIENADGRGAVVASVCHGAAGLIDAKGKGGKPLVSGRALVSWTDSEERALKLDGLVPFLLESKLRALGGIFQGGENFANHVRVDGNLVTGQNPMSSTATALATIGAAGYARAAA
jgi:putative intracellular protease/amidase